MQAGRLDRRISILRKVSVQSGSGAMVEQWQPVVLRRAAACKSVQSSERYTSPEIVAEELVEFQLRWSDDVKELSPQWRVIYPALADGETEVRATRVYDVVSVPEIGRREGLRLIATRRPDSEGMISI